jgi:hypothetical protein
MGFRSTHNDVHFPTGDAGQRGRLISAAQGVREFFWRHNICEFRPNCGEFYCLL